MTFEFLFFWLAIFVCFELFWVGSAAYFLSTLLVAVLTLVAFLFWSEFDTLASLLLGVYSSVFIVFFLLLLHFTTFWASALRQQGGSGSFIFLGVGGCLFFMLTVTGGVSHNVEFWWSVGYLWQDFYAFMGLASALSVQLLHFFFFRFFVFETVLLNFYLFFGLMLALCLLGIFNMYGASGLTSREDSGVKPSYFSNKRAVSQPSTIRVRQISKFRRQVRRQNSSTLKYR